MASATPLAHPAMRARLLITSTLAVLIIIAGIVAAVVLSNARREVLDLKCLGNLKELTLALQSYSDKYGTYPPAFVIREGDGRRMHSWRALLLEFIDLNMYHEYNFSEPWNSASNLRLASQMPACLRCPGDVTSPPGCTSYFAVIGPETLWPGDTRIARPMDRSSTIVSIVEVGTSDVNWLEPRDFTVRDVRSGRIGTLMHETIAHHDWVNWGMADGSVRRSEIVPTPDQLIELLDRRGNKLSDSLLHK